MIHSQFISGQLALIAWREAHQYGGHKPMVMVAHAIANRYRKHWGTWEWVFDHIAQYSAVNVEEQKLTGWPHPHDVAWARLLTEVSAIVEGNAPDPTNPDRLPDGGATYWADLGGITRTWFLDEIARKEEHKRVASNGTLTFWT